MAETIEEVKKAAEVAIAEARREAEQAKAELAALKGKATVGEGEKSTAPVTLTALAVLPASTGRVRGPITYPQLTRTNYGLWAMQMRVAMQSAGVWEAVSNESVSFETDRDALLAIYQGVPEDVLVSLAGKDTARAAWNAIKAAHIGHDRVRQTNLQVLRKSFEGLEMGDNETIEAFSLRLTKMVTSLRALGDDGESTTGVLFLYGASPITWFSLKQKTVALSSCEAEYIAAATAACQGVWLERLLAEFIGREERRVELFVDL